MERYHLFQGRLHEAATGGASDYKGTYPTLEAAQEAAGPPTHSYESEWAHVAQDTPSGLVILTERNGSRTWEKYYE